MQNSITKRNVDKIDELFESLPKKSGELSFHIIKPKTCSKHIKIGRKRLARISETV